MGDIFLSQAFMGTSISFFSVLAMVVILVLLWGFLEECLCPPLGYKLGRQKPLCSSTRQCQPYSKCPLSTHGINEGVTSSASPLCPLAFQEHIQMRKWHVKARPKYRGLCSLLDFQHLWRAPVLRLDPIFAYQCGRAVIWFHLLPSQTKEANRKLT